MKICKHDIHIDVIWKLGVGNMEKKLQAILIHPMYFVFENEDFEHLDPSMQLVPQVSSQNGNTPSGI